MILKVTAAAKALLATSFISLAGAQSNYTFSTVPVVDGSAETVREVVHDSTIPNTLIISYSTMAAETAIDSEIEKQKKQGMNVSVKGKTKFENPQRPISAHPGNSNKNKGNKGKNRYLESSDDILGFTTVTTSSENVDDEVNILFGIAGVTSVERDVELSILDVPGLRGSSAQDQINDIMDAVAMEQGRFLQAGEQTPFGIDMVNVTSLWSIPPKRHVKICVVDTGYDLGHPDLPITNVTGWDPSSASFGVWNVDGNRHGTHCAGTIGAIGNNGVGVVGVNPDSSRFSFHIGKGLSDCGSGSGATVIDAVNNCVANGASVISMSLGCANCYVQAYDLAYQAAYDAGVMIIAAAGNSGADTDHYPSAYKSVMSVASVMSTKELSSFSTRNDQTEIAAPGHYVLSTVPRAMGDYGTLSGTSMACPHVAGVAALLMSHFPDCTNNQIRNAMIASTTEPPTTDPRNTLGWDKYYGWGIVNAGKAYELLMTNGCVGAGGMYPTATLTLSKLALGGKNQKAMGCTSDDHCYDANKCMGTRFCDLSTNTCGTQPGTAPNCDDGSKCTIDTCDPSRTIINGDLTSMCVYTPIVCEDGNKCNGVYSCDEATGQCKIDQPVVNCNDDNACTIDTCVPSTGLCTYTTKNCDDSNPCTVGDTCDTTVGCVIQPPLDNCCGNSECEPDIPEFPESPETCPRDCSTSITTNLSSNVANWGFGGSYFNIVAKAKNMVISGIGINCFLPQDKPGKVHIFTKTGRFNDNGWDWSASAKWKLVYREDIVCNGVGQVTPINFVNTVNIPKLQAQAFNMWVTTNNTYDDFPFIRASYIDSGVNTVQQEDGFVAIEVGGGNACTTGWCALWTPFGFSGTVSYYPVDYEFTEPPTSSPSAKPTSTSKPTAIPTTVRPSSVPSAKPTSAPTKVTYELLAPQTNSATVSGAFYFEVSGATSVAAITNLQITTYGTKHMEVYMKYGTAVAYEFTPCAWKKVAETSPTWNGGSWQRTYPPWLNGFDPVLLQPGNKVSFYVVAVDTGNFLVTQLSGNSNPYVPFVVAPVTSPFGSVTLSSGKFGYNDNNRFKACTSYCGRSIIGGVKLEAADGMTSFPTSAPTAPILPGSITTAPRGTTSVDKVFGVQFDVVNIGSKDIIITKFQVTLDAGSHPVEVWLRKGSHKAVAGGCSQWHNYCGQWTKVASASVVSAGLSGLTSTPTFVGIATASATTAFAIVFPRAVLPSSTATNETVSAENGELRISLASPIRDYYGSQVQSSLSLTSSDKLFEGIINFEVAQSKCAIYSKAPWVLPGPVGGMEVTSVTEDGEPPGEPPVVEMINYEQDAQFETLGNENEF